VFNLQSYTIADLWQDVDRMKVMRLVAVHDLGESIVGDITPSDGIDKREHVLSPSFYHPKANIPFR
jgi:5'-deoxynucleotidase YfbR-like HD superfamily hydrolase